MASANLVVMPPNSPLVFDWGKGTLLEAQPFRTYTDLGDRSSDPESIREYCLLLNNEIAAVGQFSWPKHLQPWKITIENGTATYILGEGETASIRSVPFQGTNGENAIYFQTFAQSTMSQNSPTRGIRLAVTKVDAADLPNAYLSSTFVYPETGGGDSAVLYGFPSINKLSIEGWVEVVNPSPGSATYDYSFEIGVGHYAAPGTEGTFSMESAHLESYEGVTDLRIPVTRTGGSNGAVRLTFSIQDGTATLDNDVTIANIGRKGIRFGTVDFFHGEVIKDVLVWMVNDRVFEGPETFNVSLSVASPGKLGELTTTTITIHDDDPPPQHGRMSFSSGAFRVSEGAGNARVAVTRIQGSDGEVSANFMLKAGTAGGDDFSISSGTVTFPDGVISQEITVPIFDDTELERPETFTISLTDPTGGATLGSMTTGTITIEDNEPVPPEDSDNDRIPDAWERLWFNSLTLAGVGTDQDRDGFTDSEEFFRGFDPMSADPQLSQPDAQVGFSRSAMVGDNLYDSTGESERKKLTLRKGQTKTCFIYVENDSPGVNSIRMRGDGGSASFGIRYVYKGKDVTTAIKSGAFTLSNLAKGDGKFLIVSIRAKKAAAKNESHLFYFDVSSIDTPQAKDRVSYFVTAK